jgi:hypothetical protein
MGRKNCAICTYYMLQKCYIKSIWSDWRNGILNSFSDLVNVCNYKMIKDTFNVLTYFDFRFHRLGQTSLTNYLCAFRRLEA